MAYGRKGKRRGIDGAPVELLGRVSLDGRRGVWYARAVIYRLPGGSGGSP